MQEKKISIGIAGNIGAGKGTITEYLVTHHKAFHLRYSHILEDILKRLSLPYDRKNSALLGESLRRTFGGSVLSSALIQDIKRQEGELVAFEGIRKKDELEELRNLEGFVFVFVDAPIEMRYERLTQRNEKVDDRAKTLEDFKKDHERPADEDVPFLKEEADYIIDNGGSLENTQQQVDALLEKLRV